MSQKNTRSFLTEVISAHTALCSDERCKKSLSLSLTTEEGSMILFSGEKMKHSEGIRTRKTECLIGITGLIFSHIKKKIAFAASQLFGFANLQHFLKMVLSHLALELIKENKGKYRSIAADTIRELSRQDNAEMSIILLIFFSNYYN